MDEAVGGMAGISIFAIVILALWPFIVLIQLGNIWSKASQSEFHLRKIEKHLAEATKERREAQARLAASMKSVAHQEDQRERLPR